MENGIGCGAQAVDDWLRSIIVARLSGGPVAVVACYLLVWCAPIEWPRKPARPRSTDTRWLHACESPGPAGSRRKNGRCCLN